MDVKDLIQKSVDDWNDKDKEAFLAYFTESSEITAPGGLVLCGLERVRMFWEVCGKQPVRPGRRHPGDGPLRLPPLSPTPACAAEDGAS